MEESIYDSTHDVVQKIFEIGMKAGVVLAKNLQEGNNKITAIQAFEIYGEITVKDWMTRKLVYPYKKTNNVNAITYLKRTELENAKLMNDLVFATLPKQIKNHLDTI